MVQEKKNSDRLDRKVFKWFRHMERVRVYWLTEIVFESVADMGIAPLFRYKYINISVIFGITPMKYSNLNTASKVQTRVKICVGTLQWFHMYSFSNAYGDPKLVSFLRG